MNTFIKNSLPLKIDTSVLNTIETCNTSGSLDDLFEAYLSCILHMGEVLRTEISLFNTMNILTSVAESSWTGSYHKREPKVHSETWILDYPVKYTARRVGRIQICQVFSIPLMDSDTVMGFLNIQLENLNLIERNKLNQFNLMGLMLSSNIKEMRLKSKINEMGKALQLQISNNSTILHQATSLSKELYAISAISTKINQSMDFDKTLYRCLTTIRKVFKAYSILIYTQNDLNSKIELVARECEDEPTIKELNWQYLECIGKNYLKEVLKSDKPLVNERLAVLLPAPKGMESEPPVSSLIGVALKSRGTTIGAIMLLYRSHEPINHSGLRLLSGMANIISMNIENKALYRQSIQKKSEVDFLFRSIVEFNKTLDLGATLTSVAEKGAEYCGVNSCVYLFSQIKGQVIISRYIQQNSGDTISSSLRKKNELGELKHIYEELSDYVKEKPALIRNVLLSRKISTAAKPWFFELNIYSLVAVPLKVGQKKPAMLLLVRGKDATPFGQNELRFAEALASAARLTIENSRAFSASQEMSEFLEKKILEKTNQIMQIQARQRIRVENRKDIIFQVNRYNRFVFANKAMEILSGLPRVILCHKDFSADRTVAVEDREYVNGLFREILAKKIPMVKDVEYRHLNYKGDDHIISLTIFPEHDQHGRVVGVEGVGQDITEKKKLEAELKKSKELALLGEFSGAVAHQMRNPLGNILMGTKLLESALGLDGGKWGRASGSDGSASPVETASRIRIAEILKNLSLGVYNLNQVVTELLEYTKTLKLRPSPQRMEIIMRETLQTFTSLLDQYNIKVYEYFQDPLPAIPVDAVLIGQVIQNVVYNAIQAMSGGGELALFANMAEHNSDQMILSIRDSGIGIDPSEIHRIFRPFYTTKKLGSGLGLSIAHRIVEAHGGMIQVCCNPCPHQVGNNDLQTGESAPKDMRGATVHIMLPIGASGDQTMMKPN